MNYEGALQAIKEGRKAARCGWLGEEKFIYVVPAGRYAPCTDIGAELADPEDGLTSYNAYIALRNVDKSVSVWAPSTDDCLAEDWSVID
ncbi:MAG: DUF2829 domain-containing protein [Lachnospiraceae bacterium]|nr:DUF2829 domain-containing protein [Lachnospiraceae bacterium]